MYATGPTYSIREVPADIQVPQFDRNHPRSPCCNYSVHTLCLAHHRSQSHTSHGYPPHTKQNDKDPNPFGNWHLKDQ